MVAGSRQGAKTELCVHLGAEPRGSTDRLSRARIRRVLLVGAAMSPTFALLDFVNIHDPAMLRVAIGVRVLWGALIAVIALAIPRASESAFRALLSLAATVCVVLLTVMAALAGGSKSQYFQFLVAMPMCVAVCLPVETIVAVVAGIGTLACGVGLMAFEGETSPIAMFRWAMLCAMSGFLAVFSSRAYGRLRDAERKSWLERQADLKRLSAIVAHEINNQLGVLQNTVSLLRKQPSELSLLALQQETIDQMRLLVTDFLDFGTPSRGASGQVDLIELAQTYAHALSPHVDVKATSERAVIEGDGTSIGRALLNVLKNGVEAGSPVEVTVDGTSNGVTVQVHDRGPGVKREIASRIGEPFFTTKTRGTGLGLAIVRRVMADHGGHFSLYNCREGGVLAELWFPREGLPKATVRNAGARNS
jgi:signal transduction histidine kinase